MRERIQWSYAHVEMYVYVINYYKRNDRNFLYCFLTEVVLCEAVTWCVVDEAVDLAVAWEEAHLWEAGVGHLVEVDVVGMVDIFLQGKHICFIYSGKINHHILWYIQFHH